MKFITVRDFRSRPAKVWKELKKADEMILTSNGKPIALLTSVSEESLESTLTLIRRARAMAAVYAIQTRAVDDGRNAITDEEINREIEAVRRERR